MSKKKERGRFSSAKKMETVIRLIRGEHLDALSRELSVTAVTLSEWREAFMAGGQSNQKSREPSAADDVNQKLRTLVGDLTMKLEVSRRCADCKRISLWERGSREYEPADLAFHESQVRRRVGCRRVESSALELLRAPRPNGPADGSAETRTQDEVDRSRAARCNPLGPGRLAVRRRRRWRR